MASGIAPRCNGMPRPWATTRPLASQIAVEKSMLSRTTCECAVRTTVIASSSASAMNAFLTTSNVIGSRSEAVVPGSIMRRRSR